MWISRASFLIQSLNLISICAVHHCLYCFFEMTAYTMYLRLDSDFKYLASESHPFVLHFKVDATWQDTHSLVVKTHKSKECWIIHFKLLSDFSLWACTQVLLGVNCRMASRAAALPSFEGGGGCPHRHLALKTRKNSSERWLLQE